MLRQRLFALVLSLAPLSQVLAQETKGEVPQPSVQKAKNAMPQALEQKAKDNAQQVPEQKADDKLPQAAEQEPQGHTSHTPLPPAKNDIPSEPQAGSAYKSYDQRVGKVFGVGGRVGTIVSLLSGAGLDVFWVQSPSLQIGVFLGAGRVDFRSYVEKKADKSSVEAKKANMVGSLALIQARYFFSDTFNVTAGLGRRKTELDYEIEEDNGANGIKGKIKTDMAVLHAAVGNLWTFRNGLYLGADWFALSLPLGRKNADESVEERGTVSDDMRKATREAQGFGRMFAKVGSFQLALFHVGWLF